MALSLNQNSIKEENVPVVDEKVIIGILTKLKEVMDELGKIEGFNVGYGFLTTNRLSPFLKTQEICKIAVQLDGEMIEYVPMDLMSAELCKIAFQKETHGRFFKNIPEKYKTYDICLLAIKSNSINFEYVPENLKTSEICLEAVKKAGYNLGYVPEKLKTKELCMIAVQDRGKNLEYVPENLKTQEICQIAVANNEGASEFFPKNMQNIGLKNKKSEDDESIKNIFDEIFQNGESNDDYDEEGNGSDERYSKHEIERDIENIREKHSEREERTVSNNNKGAVGVKYYYCKHCGVKNSSVFGLINGSGCLKSPTKKHELYEGSEKKQYICKYCGVKNTSIAGLVNSSYCPKSPTKRHEPAL